MADGQKPPPWKGVPHAIKIESLTMRGWTKEANALIRTANAEAKLATGCKSEAAGGEVIYLPNAKPRPRTRPRGKGAA